MKPFKPLTKLFLASSGALVTLALSAYFTAYSYSSIKELSKPFKEQTQDTKNRIIWNCLTKIHASKQISNEFVGIVLGTKAETKQVQVEPLDKAQIESLRECADSNLRNGELSGKDNIQVLMAPLIIFLGGTLPLGRSALLSGREYYRDRNRKALQRNHKHTLE